MNRNLTKSSNTESAGTLRELGTFEELFWLLDQHRPVHFVMAAEVDGPTNLEDWRRALDLLQKRHAFFSVYINRNGEGKPCFRRDLTASIPLRVVQGHHATQRWELEAELELATPFDAATAPLVRVVLLHEEQRSVFLLVTHHSIADGISSTFVIRDLLQALAGSPLDPLPMLPSHEEILGVTSLQTAPVAPDGESAPAPADKPSVWIDKEDRRPRVRSLPLTLDLTRRLRERARQEGTTVHGALCSAFALAYWEASDELRAESIRVLTPIDTRKLLGLGEDCAVLIDSNKVAIAPCESTTFWEMARTATAQLRKGQTLEAIVASRIPLHGMVKGGLDVPGTAAMVAQAFGNEILLTNLGDLRYSTDFGDLQLQAVWGPITSARMLGSHCIGVATSNGALRLMHTTFGAETLLETVEELLISACATRRHVLLSTSEFAR